MAIFNKDISFVYVGECLHGGPISYFISPAD